MLDLEDAAEALMRLSDGILPPEMIASCHSAVRAGEEIEAVEDLLVELSWRGARVPEDILEVVERTAPAEWRPPQDQVIKDAIARLRAAA